MPTDNYFKATTYRAPIQGAGEPGRSIKNHEMIVCFDSSDDAATKGAWEQVKAFAVLHSKPDRVVPVVVWQPIGRIGAWSFAPIIGEPRTLQGSLGGWVGEDA